jgi:hypothetical protein
MELGLDRIGEFGNFFICRIHRRLCFLVDKSRNFFLINVDARDEDFPLKFVQFLTRIFE